MVWSAMGEAARGRRASGSQRRAASWSLWGWTIVGGRAAARLDRHRRAAAAQRGAVHLRERGGRERRVLEGGEDCLGWCSQLLLGDKARESDSVESCRAVLFERGASRALRGSRRRALYDPPRRLHDASYLLIAAAPVALEELTQRPCVLHGHQIVELRLRRRHAQAQCARLPPRIRAAEVATCWPNFTYTPPLPTQSCSSRAALRSCAARHASAAPLSASRASRRATFASPNLAASSLVLAASSSSCCVHVPCRTASLRLISARPAARCSSSCRAASAASGSALAAVSCCCERLTPR